jgi:mannose-1-phosphate guanylyltransferase
MAGGAGERFWPLSRKDRPKQLLHLTSPDKSMLAEAVERLGGAVDPDRIYIITGPHLVAPIRAAGVGIPDENIVAEPAKRNTSGALAYITAHILAKHPDLSPEQVSLAVGTADHRIKEPELFTATVEAALLAAETEGALVVCGIVPTAPETGFGYIQVHDKTAPRMEGDIPAYTVKAFHEKPNREKAEDFIAQGDYFWNSGMFFWTAAAFLRELDAEQPEMAKTVREMTAAMREGSDAAKLFESLEDISIDYALMEHAGNVLMVPGTFPWSDVGLWPALETVYPPDENGNCLKGDPVIFQSEGCIVYNEPGAEKVAVGVAGVEDLVVVVTEDAVLVVPKDRAQDVRHLVGSLKERKAKQV